MLKSLKKRLGGVLSWVSLCSWAELKSDTVISEDSYTAYSVRKYNACMSDSPLRRGEALPSCQHQYRKYIAG